MVASAPVKTPMDPGRSGAHTSRVRTSISLGLALALASPLAVSAQTPSPPRRPLGVEEALARALQANPSVRLQLLDVLRARRVREAAVDARTPTLSANGDGAFQESFAGTGAGVTRNLSQRVNLGVGLSWTSRVGTSVSLDAAFNTTWRTVNLTPGTTESTTIGPNYNASLSASVRQPILRGAGRDAVLAAEREAGAAELRSQANRDAAVSGVIRDVIAAYWELWYAERALGVQREAEVLAERQLTEARARVEIGTLSRVESLRFASELASLRRSRRSAEATVASAQIALAQLLAVDPGILGSEGEAPGDAPPRPLAVLLEEARAHSPELAAADAAIHEAEERVRSAADAARLRLDFVASVGAGGLWSDDDDLQGAALPGDRPAFTATGGLELELPVGRSAADGQLAAARAQLASAEVSREQSELALQASLREAYEGARSAHEQLPLAEEAAEVARQLAQAEQERLELGTTTTVDLLTAQQSAREAELSLLRLRVDAANAAHQLEHTAGVLLERFTLTIPEPPSLADSPDEEAP